MKYVLLCPKDQRHNNWILFKEGPRLELRGRYLPFRCPSCKKVDELKAIESGIDDGVSIRSKSDFLQTADGFVLFSKRLCDLLNENRVRGYVTYPLPKTTSYFISWPTLLAKTNAARSGVEFHGKTCRECGRPKETTMFPSLESMVLPAGRNILFASDLWAESWNSRQTWYMTTTEVKGLMVQEGITGIDYLDIVH